MRVAPGNQETELMTTRCAPHPLLWLALGAGIMAAPGAGAQEPDPGPDTTCICFERGTGDRMAFVFGRGHARLGVRLGEPETVDGRTGVRLEDVVEGTPAHGAGLRDGDIVVALDGEALGADPGASLVAAMAQREPGETVTVTYYRDGEERTARVATDAAARFRFGDAPGFGVLAPRVRLDRLFERRDPPHVPGTERFFRPGGPGGLELVAVNPELGEYFGTDRGVLVVDVADDSDLELRPGDVILAIDGRPVRDPAHARAILRSYRDDEPFTLGVVRDGRTREVRGQQGR
ncbi:MAG: PDZ domain-containing protein [Gemmatimonadota bacterium]